MSSVSEKRNGLLPFKKLTSEIVFTAVGSRGPGGQNVNKTSSAVVLRWDILNTNAFSVKEKNLLLTRLKSRISREGFLIIRSDEHRHQLANQKSCLAKLEKILVSALFIPKKRMKTRPTPSSTERRYESKRRNSLNKKMRKKVDLD